MKYMADFLRNLGKTGRKNKGVKYAKNPATKDAAKQNIDALLDEITAGEDRTKARPRKQQRKKRVDFGFLLGELEDKEEKYQPEEFALDKSDDDAVLRIARMLELQGEKDGLSYFNPGNQIHSALTAKYFGFKQPKKILAETFENKGKDAFGYLALSKLSYAKNIFGCPREVFYAKLLFDSRIECNIFSGDEFIDDDIHRMDAKAESKRKTGAFSFVAPKPEAIIAARELLAIPLFAEYASKVKNVSDLVSLALLDNLNDLAGYRTDKGSAHKDLKRLFIRSLEKYASENMPVTKRIAGKIQRGDAASQKQTKKFCEEVFKERKPLFEYAVALHRFFDESYIDELFFESDLTDSIDAALESIETFDCKPMIRKAIRILEKGYSLMPARRRFDLKKGHHVYTKKDDAAGKGRRITASKGIYVKREGETDYFSRRFYFLGSKEYSVSKDHVDKVKKELNYMLNNEVLFLTDETGRVGLKVRIRKNSRYFGQHQGFGTIEDTESSDHMWVVEWPDGYNNCYRTRDLEVRMNAKKRKQDEKASVLYPDQYRLLKSKLKRGFSDKDKFKELFSMIESEAKLKDVAAQRKRLEKIRDDIYEMYNDRISD